MPRREPRQPAQPSLQQRLRTLQVPPPVVVKRRRYLNDSLQKCLVRFRRSQPNLFPGLMRIEKSPAVELPYPGLKPLAMLAGRVFSGRACIPKRHSSGFLRRWRLPSMPAGIGPVPSVRPEASSMK